VGPNLAVSSKYISDTPFAGAFLVLTGLYVLALVLLWFLPMKNIQAVTASAAAARPLKVLFAQPLLVAAVLTAVIGHSLMVLLMNATPLSMHDHGHDFAASAFVIQWHVLGMFIPSFFTGRLISQFGEGRIIALGGLLLLVCQGVNQLGHAQWIYILALVLLGVGWNFMFIGATSLLPKTYLPSEKAKVQGVNDSVVFGVSAVASLLSGVLHHHIGWPMLNLGTMPLVVFVLAIVYWGMRGRIRTTDSAV
jgi:MFS family permease